MRLSTDKSADQTWSVSPAGAGGKRQSGLQATPPHQAARLEALSLCPLEHRRAGHHHAAPRLGSITQVHTATEDHPVTMSATPLRLDAVAAELRAIGITLESRPGEYRVNFRNGKEDTACYTEGLQEALAAGRAMAATAVSDQTGQTVPAATRKWRRRPRRMTSKAQRRRMIRKHNRRMRARAIRAKE